MPNEILLAASVLLCFGGVLAFWRLLGEVGMYCWTVLATIAANIEVLILVDAFGFEQTLGNVMFASLFLATDILSERVGKKQANRAVNIGILASVTFILVSQLWLQFTPSPNDWAMSSVEGIFTQTPRLMLSSLAVYVICQKFDIWLYHRIWNATKKRTGNPDSFLWLRNNGATMTAQLLNVVLFNLLAFWGLHDAGTIASIIVSGYLIYLVTSLLDTPALYLARKMKAGAPIMDLAEER